MSKLACNIVAYRPDPDMLAANFSPRHLEALLDQAAILIDRCVVEFREYCSLDRAWSGFKHDLEIQEKEVELDRKRVAEQEPEPAAPATELRQGAGEPEADGNVAAEPGQGEAQEEGEGAQPGAAELESSPELEDAEITSMLGLRSEAVQRKKELAGPGRPFAIDEQRDLVLRRLCRDYEEAVNRVGVAEEGLRMYFDWGGEPSPLSSWADTLGASITSYSIWIRNAIEWLGRYRQKEQAFTRAFSVRALMNRNAWGQLRHARDSFSVRLQVPPELFLGFDNCRFLGVSASLIGEAGTVPWSVVLRLPDAALFVRSGLKVEVDQSALPACLLGRVENRRSVRRSEFCGMVSHVNASPLGRPTQEGQWSLELLRPVGSATELFALVDDLVIEIKTAGVPQATER